MARGAAALAHPETPALAHRVDSLDWARIATELDERGCAATGVLLSPAECAALRGGYDEGSTFRSKVIMARHGFGRGEYKYYAYPLPPDVVRCARRSIRIWRRLPTGGRRHSAARRCIRRAMKRISSAATRPGSAGPRRCC